MSETFPPSDFVVTDSAVSGITVYMPKPPEEKQEAVVEFRCPQCNGETAYSAADGGLTCTYCGFYEPPQQQIVGKRADEFEFTVDTVQRSARGWGSERLELVCSSCAAHTTLSMEMLTHTCPFCGSNQVVQAKAPQEVLRPRFLIPVSVSEDECRQKTAVWLQSSWMVPKGLQTLARGAQYNPVYIPYWTFDAATRADWKAEVGHTRTRTRTVNGKRQTSTYTEWRWESGRVELFTDDYLVSGTTHLSERLLKQTSQFNLNALVAYNPSYLAGISAQSYDVKLEPAWDKARHAMREKTKQACRRQCSTRRIRNFSMNLDFADETWRLVLLPMYVAVYYYANEPYQLLINGQTGAVAGQRPVDWRKVGLAMAAMWLPGVLLMLALILLNATGNTPNDDGLLTIISIGLLVVALIANLVTFLRAQAMDDI